MSTAIQPGTQWQQWREARNAEFSDPYGWLSLVALEWLGAAPTPVAGLPGLWWTSTDGFHVDVPAEAGLLVDGVPAAGHSVVWDGEGDAPAISSGERRLELLSRGLLRGVRVRDPRAPGLLAFSGVPVFDYDPAWRITATWRPYESLQPLSVAAVVPGLVHRQLVAGEASFVVGGRTQVLKVNDGDWIAFRDASNGVSTTRHCRWVDVTPSTDGTVVIDFNLSANPPCAFTDFGTCPLPPEGNDLDVAVLAGERAPRPGH